MLNSQFPVSIFKTYPDLIVESGQTYIITSGSNSSNVFRNVWIKPGGILRLSATASVDLTAIKCSSFKNEGSVEGIYATTGDGSVSGTYFGYAITFTRTQQPGGAGGQGTNSSVPGASQSNGNGGKGGDSIVTHGGGNVPGGPGGPKGSHGQSLLIVANTFLNSGSINLKGSNGTAGINGAAHGSGYVSGSGGGGAGGNGGNLYIRASTAIYSGGTINLSGGSGGIRGQVPPLNPALPNNTVYFGKSGTAGIAGQQL